MIILDICLIVIIIHVLAHYVNWMLILVVLVVYRIFDWILRQPSVNGISSKYILVTGCDSGFGNLLVKKLDTMGFQVFAGCLTETGETNLKKSCSERVIAFHMDVTCHDSVLKAHEFIQETLPESRGLWGLVNNAGVAGVASPPELQSKEDYRSVFEVNLFGLVDVTTVFLPLIKKAKGRIVNTASIMGRVAFFGSGPYSASKFGVEAFSDSIRQYLKLYGVRVSMVEPGFFNTNLTEYDHLSKVVFAAFHRSPKEIQDEIGTNFISKILLNVKLLYSTFLSSDLDLVVDAYINGLTALYPRKRYSCGYDARFIFIPMSYLPSWVLDLLTYFGLPTPAALEK